MNIAQKIRAHAPAISGTIILLLLVLTVISVRYNTKRTAGLLIAQHVKELAAIFTRINKECSILGFDHQKNRINFLTVEKFVGSEVGSMNLGYPSKWRGPYLSDNPTMQGKEYLVVRTKKGLFITPGEGVKLPNGKIIGKDISLDENADLLAMTRDSQALMYKDRPLAQKLDLRGQAELPTWNE